MFNFPTSVDPELLKSLLEPLLEDFQYWFSRSRTLFQEEHVSFLDPSEQQDLLARVIDAQNSVSAMQALLDATGGHAGVDTKVLMGWHRLVHECWGISRRLRELRD